MASNSSELILTLPSFVGATAAFAVVSCFSSLSVIAIVVYLKALRRFIFRLTFHLALASFFRALSVGLSVAPVDIAASKSNGSYVLLHNGAYAACAFLGAFRQYTFLWCSAVILWACLYVIKKGLHLSKKKEYDEIGMTTTDRGAGVFMAAVRRHRWEVTGHLIVALLPILVLWIPYTEKAKYELNGAWCWISNELVFRILSRLPATVGSLTCIAVMLYIVIKYYRKARREADPWQLVTVRSVLPCLIYTMLFGLSSVASILHPIVGENVTNKYIVSCVEMAFLTLYYVYDVSILVTLFLHRDIRSAITVIVIVKLKAYKNVNDNGLSASPEDEYS